MEPRRSGVAAVAQRAPARVALDMANGAVTYGELDTAADRLAQWLIDDHGGGELPASVALCIEGSLALAVAAEAVTRAGMVLVPIDAASSPDRVGHVAELAGAALVLSDVVDLADLPIPTANPLDTGSTPPRGGVHQPRGLIDSIVFTFESTQRPRGVVRPPSRPVIGDDLPWREGARIAVPSLASSPAGLAILREFLDCGWTIVGPGASADVLVVDDRWLGEPISDVHVALTVGTATTWDDVCTIRKRFGEEVTVIVVHTRSETGALCRQRIDPSAPLGTGEVPAGFPFPGLTVSIVGEGGEPCAPGQRGEIIVSGDAVALEYLHEKAASAAVFGVTADGERFVRTGDAGLLRSDGSLVPAGRLPHVTEVAGMRVDLREVEARLLKSPDVAAAAATTYVNDAGELRLTAYVVAPPTRFIHPRTLRSSLATLLAPSALPDAILAVEELPRRPDGQVDRDRLPGDRPPNPVSRSTPRGPSDELERDLLSVWSEVLGLGGLCPDDLSVDDSFFDLGGDSLTAVHLMSEIEARLGVDVPVLDLIEHPTVTALAALIRSGGSVGDLIEIQRGDHGPALFVAHDIYGNLFGDRHHLTAVVGPGQAILGLRAEAWEGGPLERRSLEDLAAVYVSSMLRHQPQGPYWLWGQLTGGLLAFEMARQLQGAGHDLGLLVLGATHAPARPAVPLSGLRSAMRLPPRYAVAGLGTLGLRKARYLARTPERRRRARRQRAVAQETLSATYVPPEHRKAHVLRYYWTMFQDYRPAGPVTGPVILIRSTADDTEREAGWKPWVAGSLEVLTYRETASVIAAAPDDPLGALRALGRTTTTAPASRQWDR